jgi:hypothetical protein
MNRELRALKPLARKLYRDCVRATSKLQGNHQFIWKDYIKLKYQQHASIRDPNEIKKLIEQANDELKWALSLIERKRSM